MSGARRRSENRGSKIEDRKKRTLRSDVSSRSSILDLLSSNSREGRQNKSPRSAAPPRSSILDPLSSISPPPAIDVRNTTVTRGKRKILSNISWSVPAGGCAAILGPNGSGKSTLARVIMGQMWPSSGEVRILGQLFGETDLNELRESIRLVQSANVVEFDPEETVQRVVLTGFFGTVGLYQSVTPAMTRRAEKLIRQVGLKAESSQAYRTLSSGERMRCLVARALVVEPKLLILDEPTAGLDVLAREQVLATVQQLVRESKSPPAMLMITHHVEELLPETKSVLILKAGKMAAVGLPRQVLTTEVLSDVYEFPVQVTRRGGRFWLHVKTDTWKSLTAWK